MCAHGCRVERSQEKTNKPVKWLPVVLVLLIAVAAGIGCGLLLSSEISDAMLPHLSLNPSASGIVSHEQIVRMNMTPVLINATASAQVYAGANNASTPCYGSFDTYYPAIITDPLQNDFYANLLQQFQRVKQTTQLDENQYAELIVAYVQSIPYDNNASISVKYPVVTAVGGTGDCDDTALLLAGLLAKEGYDVELLLYPENGHMAVGIKTDDQYAYPDTGGYAYIETTGESLIVCGNYSLGILNETEVPVCIRIGNGTKAYTAGYECSALFQYLLGVHIADESGKHQPIVLNPEGIDTVSEEVKTFQVNAFDREYLYRSLIAA